MADEKDQQTGLSTSFTVDADESGVMDMPSITKLLNRKSLGIPTAAEKKAAKAAKAAPPGPPPAAPSPPPMAPPSAPIGMGLEAPPVGPPPTPEPAAAISLENLFAPKTAAPAPPAPEPVLASPAAPASPPPAAGGEISLSFEAPAEFQLEQSSKAPVAAAIEPTPSAGIAAPAPAPSAAPEISLSSAPEPEPAAAPAVIESPSPAASVTPIKVQRPAKRAARAAPQQLINWDLKTLKGGLDPLGKGLAHFIERGATSALFLAITTPPEGCPVPHFLATAATNASPSKLGIWAGLKWDPTVVPELWNYFIKAGYTELPPPGSFTNVKSIRNVVRSAFGIEKEEWILLLRAGPPNACRGVVAIVSKKSLLSEITVGLPLVAALPPKAA